MSKSHADERSRILLTDSKEAIHKKVKAALTDSEPTITYDPARRPGVSNLIEIVSHLDGVSPTELALEYKSASLRSLKEHVADRIADHLAGIRHEYYSLIEDRTGRLEQVAERGAISARANSEATMKKVREAIGL